MTIFIEDSFDSAHFLPHVPDGHKCRRIHGHTYRIRIELSGRVGARSGWVVDYADVKLLWNSVKQTLDHFILNDIQGLHNPTCENLAAWVWDELSKYCSGLSRIEIRETEHCGAVYEGE